MLKAMKAYRTVKARLVATLLAVSLCAMAMNIPSAYAAGGCRADPIITLSNGLQLNLYVTLNDPAGLADVSHVSYVVHGPALPFTFLAPFGKVSSGNGWYTILYPDGTGSISSFSYVPDGTAGTYTITMLATTKTPGIAMTANIGWALGSGILSLGAAVQGTSGQTLQLNVRGLFSM